MNTDFDYIIAGGGCSGLSLAYCLSKSSLADKKILIVDKETKLQNDKTWCFWTQEATPFDNIVYRQWKHIEFITEDYHQIYNLLTLNYKIIRGIDFYREVKQQLAKFPNIIFVQDTIINVSETAENVILQTQNQTFSGKYLFDSRISPETYKDADRILLQHFKGWVIKTEKPRFDVSKMTMFDFRIDQANEIRFFYILPYENNKALIEFTIFGKEVFKNQDDYLIPLKNYITNILEITDFEIEEEEFGIIPMTDFEFADRQGQRIKRIGIAGGQSKASTGYTFLNIQRDSMNIVKSLETTGQPFYKKDFQKHFRLYDKMILDIMLRKGGSIKDIFAILFRNNPIEDVLYFLDNQTNFATDLKIMASVPPMPFLKSIKNIIL
jgi:lycopene beta-cyclase